jgi:methylenetetrahydrofolate reductase (NADPH)
MLPILSGSQLKKFTTLCGATIPTPMRNRLDELGENDEAAVAYGIEYATRQCEELLREGVEGLHFYTLNKVRSTVEVWSNLGLAAGA